MIRSVCALVVSTALLLPVSAHAEVFGAKETVLDNGLHVVAIENSRAPVVTQVLFYRVGAMDEAAGQSGIAHFLEHLMFKGTDTMESGEFSATVARNGGQDNAFTSQDTTAYFQSVASDRLELIMQMEADRMANLDIPESEFGPEKKVVLEERSQRTDSDPASILWEQSNRAFYRNHPYGLPIIGWRHEIEALTQEDIEAFYERYYAPNNAILVVAGDVTAEEVFALAEKHYGPIPSREIKRDAILEEPPLLVSTTVSYRDDRVTQPSLSIRKPAPSWGTAEDKSVTDALDVLSEILAGGSTGRLYRALVIDQGIAVAAGGWYQGSQRGPGLFGLYASPAPGNNLDAMDAALRAEIQTLLSEGVTEDEVSRAITRLQDAAATARDSLSGPAMTIGRTMVMGMSLEEIETWPERIGAVTVEDVNAAAQIVFAPQGEVITHLLPAEPQE